mgnify:CR=1 FL=1
MKTNRIVLTSGAVLLLVVSGLFAQSQSSSSQSSQQSELVAAYQREFVYLDNEIRLLQQRLEEVNQSGQSRVEDARADLQELETRLLRLTADVDRRTDDLNIVQEEADDAQDANDALENIDRKSTRLNSSHYS